MNVQDTALEEDNDDERRIPLAIMQVTPLNMYEFFNIPHPS